MIQSADRTLAAHITGLLRLTRWQEHIVFTVPATLLGMNLAFDQRGEAAALDGRLVTVLVANILAVTFAFMVNDIEDAPDDARAAARAAHNAVSSGAISPRVGWLAAVVVGGLALVLFASNTEAVLGTGTLTIVLGWLYSWRRVRLKALPVVDVLAHLLMLSSCLFLAGYFAYVAYADTPGQIWLVALGVGLVSAYGQLYNQVRDYELDRAAGLRNTAYVLGQHATHKLMYLCLLGAALCLALTVALGVWPLWLGVVPLMLTPCLLVFRSNTDMRGTPALDASGRMQLGAMLIATITLLVWLFFG